MLVINRARFPLKTGRGWGASWVATATDPPPDADPLQRAVTAYETQCSTSVVLINWRVLPNTPAPNSTASIPAVPTMNE